MVPSSSSSSVFMTIVPNWDSKVPSCSIMVLAPSLIVLTTLMVPVSSPLALTMVPESVSSSSCTEIPAAHFYWWWWGPMKSGCIQGHWKILLTQRSWQTQTETSSSLFYALRSLPDISKWVRKAVHTAKVWNKNRNNHWKFLNWTSISLLTWSASPRQIAILIQTSTFLFTLPVVTADLKPCLKWYSSPRRY